MEMKECLSAKEAWQMLGISRATLYRYVEEGKVPCFRVGRLLRFHRVLLENWIYEQTETQTRQKAGK